jgi:hypothetical protein
MMAKPPPAKAELRANLEPITFSEREPEIARAPPKAAVSRLVGITRLRSNMQFSITVSGSSDGT